LKSSKSRACTYSVNSYDLFLSVNRIVFWIIDGQIQKTIRFTDKNKSYEFTEYVQALDLDDFKDLLERTDMFIVNTYGNYQMEAFDPDNSDRLILICKKKTN